MLNAASAVSALVRRATSGHCVADSSDAELLARFVTHRDTEAFAGLVHRHGSMVLAVGRRVSGDAHLAEDVFQAVFLVLARRASDVKPGNAVRGWLYGVAVRTAKEARAIAARRRARETPVSHVPDRPAPTADPPDADALRALDEEIGRLPEHLRAAVVLFEIDGLSRQAVAERLGIPEGTLASRLGKARKVLAARLRGRGVTVPIAGLVAACSSGATAAVRPALVVAAVRMSAPGLIPIPALVAELARGACRTMFMKTMLVLGFMVTAVAGLMTASGAPQDRGVPTKPPVVAAPATDLASAPQKAKPSSPNRIFITGDNGLVSVDPDGKDEQKLDVPESAKFWAVPSPDGLKVAYLVESADEKIGSYLAVADIGGRARASRFRFPTKIGYLSFCWSPDGTRIHACTGMEGVKGVQHYRLDLKGMTPLPLDILKTRTVDEWATDGKSLVTSEVGNGDQWEPKSVHLVDLDGKEKNVLAAPKEGWAVNGRLSPDGKRLLVGHDSGLAIVDVGRPETLKPVADGPGEHVERDEYGWSPDGKRIVFRRQKGTLDKPGDVELVVADPDGKNAKVIRKTKEDGIWKVYWR